jgi:hypothetical protein
VTSAVQGAIVDWVTPFRLAANAEANVGDTLGLAYIRNRLQANELDVDTGVSISIAYVAKSFPPPTP